MSKIKSLSELGNLYSTVQESSVNQPSIDMGNKLPDILLTDATQYVPESKMVKPGSAMGGGPGTKEVDGVDVTAPWPNSGPEGMQPGKNGFKKVTAKQVADLSKPGEAAAKTAGEETEKEEKEMEAALKNEDPKESMKENVDSASGTPKYKKQQFTMPKSKFQKLYEDAINGGPFVKEEEEMTPVAPAADDVGGEIEAEPTGTEEHPLTHDEIIEMLEKALEALKKHAGYEDTHGGKDVEAGAEGEEESHHEEEEEEEEESAIAEDVEAEDMGHALVDGKSEELKDGHKIHKVGSLKQKGAATEQGAKSVVAEPTPKKQKEVDAARLNPKNPGIEGNLKVSKGTDNAFE